MHYTCWYLPHKPSLEFSLLHLSYHHFKHTCQFSIFEPALHMHATPGSEMHTCRFEYLNFSMPKLLPSGKQSAHIELCCKIPELRCNILELRWKMLELRCQLNFYIKALTAPVFLGSQSYKLISLHPCPKFDSIPFPYLLNWNWALYALCSLTPVPSILGLSLLYPTSWTSIFSRPVAYNRTLKHLLKV